jgi:hypothetical protein
MQIPISNVEIPNPGRPKPSRVNNVQYQMFQTVNRSLPPFGILGLDIVWDLEIGISILPL